MLAAHPFLSCLRIYLLLLVRRLRVHHSLQGHSKVASSQAAFVVAAILVLELSELLTQLRLQTDVGVHTFYTAQEAVEIRVWLIVSTPAVAETS